VRRALDEQQSQGIPRLLLAVDEAAACFGIGRSQMYHLIKGGDIASFTIGAYRKIPVAALEAYVERRCAEMGVSCGVTGAIGAAADAAKKAEVW
jgi:excisionase family DNA binding protein